MVFRMNHFLNSFSFWKSGSTFFLPQSPKGSQILNSQKMLALVLPKKVMLGKCSLLVQAWYIPTLALYSLLNFLNIIFRIFYLISCISSKTLFQRSYFDPIYAINWTPCLKSVPLIPISKEHLVRLNHPTGGRDLNNLWQPIRAL